MPKNSFKLNGKPLAKPVPIAVLRIIGILEKMKLGDLLTTRELCARSGYTRESLISNYSGYQQLSPYKATVRFPRRQLVWGSRKTITALRRHKEVLA
jgi:hypothetical protein